MSISSSERLRTAIGLLMITAAAVYVQGYHLGVDDAGIYVPGIKHAHLTLFPDLVGDSARLTGLPVDLLIFAWYLAGVFLLMLASWRLVCACFQNEPARWGGVALVAALLVVPVAGTGLAIADPYVTARTLSTPATIFAIGCFISGRRKQAAVWWLFSALIHPQMSFYLGVFLGCIALAGRQRKVAGFVGVPASALVCSVAHVEWPGADPANHTPKDAVFALDPQYLWQPGEDMHGFRAVAERSMLADNVKDSGAVSLFPQLADGWECQERALAGWKHFHLSDFERIGREFPVTWVVIVSPAAAGLICPYDEHNLEVCRIPSAGSGLLRTLAIPDLVQSETTRQTANLRIVGAI